VTALPLKGDTRALRNAPATHWPTDVPANGPETLTDLTEPSGENVTLAEPEPDGPSASLQAAAADAALPSAANAAPRLSGARWPSGAEAKGDVAADGTLGTGSGARSAAGL
jgi:hypothetical protein